MSWSEGSGSFQWYILKLQKQLEEYISPFKTPDPKRRKKDKAYLPFQFVSESLS